MGGTLRPGRSTLSARSGNTARARRRLWHITSFVVFQLALVGLPELTVVVARVLSTVLGGALGLLAHLLWPTSGRQGTAGAGFDVGA